MFYCILIIAFCWLKNVEYESDICKSKYVYMKCPKAFAIVVL